MKTPIFAVLTILLALGAIGCQTQEPISAAADIEAMPILRQTQLDEPGLKHMGVMLINSRVELEQKAPEANALDAIDVDFSKESLLVLCLGERPTGGYWAMVTGVQRDAHDDALYVQGIANQPGEKETTTQAITHPCSVAILSKVSAEVIHPEIDSRTGMPLPPMD